MPNQPDKKQPTEIKPSVSKYLIPKEKHEEHVNFRVSCNVLRLVEEMMPEAKVKLPWKTSTDFHRWAVWYGLLTISGDLRGGKFTNMFEHVNTHMEIARRAAFRRSALDILDSTAQEVREMDRLGGSDDVPRFLREVEGNIQKMELNFWTVKVKAEFYRMYGQRLKEGRIPLQPSKAVHEDE